MTTWMPVKKLVDNINLPSYATDGSIGLDLQVTHDAVCYPGEYVKCHTGLAIELPTNHVGMICNRSSLSLRGLQVGGGIIDPDYRGEVVVILNNIGPDALVIKEGERVAQLLVLPVAKVNMYPVDELSTTERNAGGFGSTGR